jgi:hypothetical protein
MPHYDPASIDARRALAAELRARLTRAQFEVLPAEKGRREEVWAFQTPAERIRVLVYTTIDGASVRREDADAIRVVAVYRAEDGTERGIVREPKVLRNRQPIEAIADRVIERARDCYRRAARPATCRRCGAPLFKSKKGNEVCAELCWLPRDAAPQRAQAASQRADEDAAGRNAVAHANAPHLASYFDDDGDYPDPI